MKSKKKLVKQFDSEINKLVESTKDLTYPKAIRDVEGQIKKVKTLKLKGTCTEKRQLLPISNHKLK